ncbi:hypothetical protein ACE38W_05015 [Chitinophaga sp. Hz27]|uniref:hypothetical protein n=1 Tax=Chitinophaga sp. Hz27 TaxID=3347169 RepID=UPI0035DA9186
MNRQNKSLITICSLILEMVLTVSLHAQQSAKDTIYVTKGAATFLHAADKILTVQSGNTSGKELQYQIIQDRDLLFTTTGLSRSTNLLVVTEKSSYYFIVQYKENVPLSLLKYELEGKTAGKESNSTVSPLLPECPEGHISANTDTVMMNRLINEIMHQRLKKLLAKTTMKGIQVSVRKVLLLNRYCYFSIEVRNRSHIPVELQPIRVYKSSYGINASCMPVLMDVGADVIATGETVRHMITVEASILDRRDKILFSISGNGISPLILKMAASKLPGYILAAR